MARHSMKAPLVMFNGRGGLAARAQQVAQVKGGLGVRGIELECLAPRRLVSGGGTLVRRRAERAVAILEAFTAAAGTRRVARRGGCSGWGHGLA
jgi:hypothetical protein